MWPRLDTGNNSVIPAENPKDNSLEVRHQVGVGCDEHACSRANYSACRGRPTLRTRTVTRAERVPLRALQEPVPLTGVFSWMESRDAPKEGPSLVATVPFAVQELADPRVNLILRPRSGVSDERRATDGVCNFGGRVLGTHCSR